MLKKVIAAVMLITLVGCSNTKSREDYYTNYRKTGSSKNNIYKERVYSNTLKGDRVDLYGKYQKDNFPIARPIPYLLYVNDMENPRIPFRSYTEQEFLSFYKNLNAKGYGDNSRYWRWNFTLSKKQISNILNKNLPNLARRRSREVLTLSGGKWVAKKVPLNPIGTLHEIKVLQRGKSGLIIKLMIRGSRGTYLVVKEGNVRNILGLSKKNVGSTVSIYGARGGDGKYSTNPISRNPYLLPSAFFAFEKLGSGGYKFYGGGFGHGSGIPQWTAMDLTRNKGLNYQQVLKRYYPNTQFRNINSVKGMGNIRVGIMDTGFKSLEHSKITLYSAGKIKLRSRGGNLNISPRTYVEFRSKNGYTNVIVGGKVKLRTKHYITVSSSRMISVPSIRRHIKRYRFPTYRGTFEIRPSRARNYLRLINEVSMENYLLQVVPSEMPKSFGLEALKVQAVAARTYAAKDHQRNRYKKSGFHILDSTQSQVYNNLDENEITEKAVKSTKGIILTSDNKPIDAKYYSTSSGFNSSAHNVW